MRKPSNSIVQVMLKTLAQLKESSELTADEVAWLEQFSVRLLAEFDSSHEELLSAEVPEG